MTAFQAQASDHANQGHKPRPQPVCKPGALLTKDAQAGQNTILPCGVPSTAHYSTCTCNTTGSQVTGHPVKESDGGNAFPMY